MDLVGAVSSIQQGQTATAISYSVAKKTLDSERQQGAAALQLLQSAAGAGPGDELAAAATGLGGQVDTYA